MNILFLTLSKIYDLSQRGIYNDLMHEFVRKGHNVYIAAPAERRFHEKTNLKAYDGYSVLRIKVGNMQKCNVIEKGISTLLFEYQFLNAIKKFYADVKFDLVIYSTPPITFSKVVDYVKRRDNAKTYLLLKDIFPQNAVDLGMFSKKSIFYKYFRRKEKHLYKQSDYIGCMSQANVDYVLKHNSEINSEIVHVSPNSIEVSDKAKSEVCSRDLRKKYNIPQDTTVFVYGGNLGKPQGIPFLIECLRANMNKSDRFFIISGTGTEYGKLKRFIGTEKPDNVLLINGLPKSEYEDLVMACDVGLIFLDHRFTIPNFPSRVLSYMQISIPIIACTDPNTDVGKVICDGGFGWWCESNDVCAFNRLIEKAISSDRIRMGDNAFKYMLQNYTTEISYKIIMRYIEQ